MKKQRLTQKELHVLIQDQSTADIRYSRILISDKTITESFNINGGLRLPIYFEECIFLDKFDITLSTIDVAINFKHCYFCKDLSFLSTTFTKNVIFFDCKLRGDFLIIESNLIELIAYFSFCNSIICTFNSKLKKLFLGGKENVVFGNLNLNLNSIEERLYISDCTFKKLIIKGNLAALEKDRHIEIFNCKINSFYIESVNNTGIFKLHYIQSLNIPSEMSFFTINKSNLGKAEFIQFDFSSFSEINILNSIMTDCFFVNTIWSGTNINVFKGKEMDGYLKDRQVRKGIFLNSVTRLHENSRLKKLIKKNSLFEFKETKEQLNHKKDIFKQIKYAVSKQGDSINEKIFYSLEMTSYNASLPWNGKTLSTKAILSLSKLTSNYGLSLCRPLLLLLSNLIPFLILVLIHKIPNVYLVPFLESNFEGICNAIAQFLFVLNPLRKFETDIHLSVILLDILIRIISSYAIYNIVRATRRFIS